MAPTSPHARRYASTALASKSLVGRSLLCAKTCCPQIVAGAVALTCRDVVLEGIMNEGFEGVL